MLYQCLRFTCLAPKMSG